MRFLYIVLNANQGMGHRWVLRWHQGKIHFPVKHFGWIAADHRYEGLLMTLVGVISDTHGILPQQAYEALAECDAIIHAGDICGPKILRELETLASVYAVLGNNDYDEYGESVSWYARPVINGVKFLVAHYPKDVAISAFGSSAVAPGDPIPDVRIHGHTHIPKLERGREASPSQLLMCPGAVNHVRSELGRTIGKIEVDDGRILSARIESLTGKVLMD